MEKEVLLWVSEEAIALARSIAMERMASIHYWQVLTLIFPRSSSSMKRSSSSMACSKRGWTRALDKAHPYTIDICKIGGTL